MRRSLFSLWIVLLFALAVPTLAEAQIYVDKDATGAGDGTSWADAYTDLQTAIDNATGESEIWIAEGIYTPDPDGGDRAVSFRITGEKDGIEIYGGFEGEESSRSGRDPGEHSVILSGDLEGNDGSDTDGDGIPDAGRGENSYHVVVFDGGDRLGADVATNVTLTTVLDGVTITGGNADGDFPDSAGGGLYCDGEGDTGVCNPTLRNLVFTANTADLGGAMFNDGDGGAGNFLGFNGTSSPRIIHSTFAGNKAASGGAIYNAGRDGGVSSPEIVNTTFTGNTASDRGGAILSDGDAGSSSPQVTNTTFTDNTASSGGAMYNDGRNGGTSSPEVANTAFAGNTVSDQGGAIFNNAEMGASSPQIANATFTNNVASSGGAVYNHGAGGSNRPEIANTILWSNTASSSGDEIYNYSAEPTLTHTLIQGGLGDIVNDAGSSTTDGGGNLTQDPLFADASNPDGPDDTPATADDGLRLTGGSPALDAGNNNEIPLDATDLDGDNTTFEPIPFDITGTDRIRDNDGDAATSPAVDVGAYEAPADVVLPVELASLEGTHTGDGVQLSWTTTSETNNAGFQVQRRTGSGSWSDVRFVEGGGTTSEPQRYRFVDTHLPYAADSLRYRLKQVDTDGSVSLTDPITVARGGLAGLELLGTAPNPASRRATVRYAVPEGAGGDVTLRLYDVLGRTVRTVTARAEAGRHTRTLDVSGLASGAYFLRLQAGGQAVTRKLTVAQ